MDIARGLPWFIFRVVISKFMSNKVGFPSGEQSE
jgi:hypothetical protein